MPDPDAPRTDTPRTDAPQLDAEKQRLRAAAKQSRARAAAATPDAGSAVAEAVLAALDEGRIPLAPGASVSGYWPKGDELDPRPLMTRLSERGHPVGLPVVTGRNRPLTFRRWAPADQLVPAAFGLLEPGPDQPEVLPDLLLVPLLAFDRNGWRLGYGGGFYDRTVAKLQGAGRPLTVGLAYAGQAQARVPHGTTDRPMDWIATERELLATSESEHETAVLR